MCKSVSLSTLISTYHLLHENYYLKCRMVITMTSSKIYRSTTIQINVLTEYLVYVDLTQSPLYLDLILAEAQTYH